MRRINLKTNKMQEQLIKVEGNFSNVNNRDEYKIIEIKADKIGNINYICKRRKAKNKKFTTNVTLCGTSLIIEDTKSVYHNNTFIGNIKEIRGGFIPCNSINNYHNKRVYKTFESAKNRLIEDRYKSKEKVCFGFLAQQEFYYTKNLLKNLSLYQRATLITQFTDNLDLSIRIVKKYFRKGIVGYYGQGNFNTVLTTNYN
jgi:hypothetical protein